MVDKIRVLCFGDSNTYGTIPHIKPTDNLADRFDENTRWTALLSLQLGSEYHVIEEGLGGRTTMYDIGREPFCYFCNGLNQIIPCVMTHVPLDLIIIMLGTNDLQSSVEITEKTLGDGIQRIIDELKKFPICGRNNVLAKILVISPVHIKKSKTRPEVYEHFRFENGEKLSKLFAEVYKDVAEKNNCYFLDAALYAYPSDADGIHMTPEGHKKLAQAVSKEVREIFNT